MSIFLFLQSEPREPAAKKPQPLLLTLDLSANSSAVDDPGVKVGEA